LRAPKGFTSIELVVTIVIAGILSSLAVASLGPLLANRRLREAAQQVEQVIRKAQQLARTRDQITYVSFDSPGNTYTLFAGNPCSAVPSTPTNTDTLGQNMQIPSTTLNFTCPVSGAPRQNIIAFDNRGYLAYPSSVNQCIGVGDSTTNSQSGYFVCIMTASGDVSNFFVNNISNGPPAAS
jgi:prepilin-type N-terminal cleavage/methylation domain-containing protein